MKVEVSDMLTLRQNISDINVAYLAFEENVGVLRGFGYRNTKLNGRWNFLKLFFTQLRNEIYWAF